MMDSELMERQHQFSQTVKAGFIRVCADFDERIKPFGFKRARKSSREWTRRKGALVERIYFYRNGSSYGGTPINNSITIRVYFSVNPVDAPETEVLLSSDNPPLRDERGYAYHLRFNTLSWSTYGLCLDDLMRLMNDHGFPWFSQQKISLPILSVTQGHK